MYDERDQISTLLRAHHPMGGRCWCGFEWKLLGEWSDHVAEAIIAATTWQSVAQRPSGRVQPPGMPTIHG